MRGIASVCPPSLPLPAPVQVPFTALAVVLAQTYTAVALYVSSARLGFEAVDDELIAASRTLGVPMWRTFWRVVLPLPGPRY